MKNILVTGASGFLGRRLVSELTHFGYSVIAAARNLEGIQESDVKLVPLDIVDRAAFNRLPGNIDTIIHAAVVRPQPGKGWEDLRLALQTNLIGTLNLLEYAEENKIRKFIYCSTLSVYQLPQPLPIPEEGLTYPAGRFDSDYGILKLAGELLCTRLQTKEFCAFVSLRFGRIYGPTENSGSLLSQWIEQAKMGKEIIVYGNGERSLDFLYIEDAVRAIQQALNSEEGGIFNLGYGEEVTWKVLAETIVSLFSPKEEVVPIRYIEDGDRSRCVLDTTRARKILNFIPGFSLEKGLRKWKESYR